MQDLSCVPTLRASHMFGWSLFQIMFLMARFCFIISVHMFASLSVSALYCVNRNKQI